MSDGLILRAEVVAAVTAHARHELPNEACGLLAGTAAGQATRYLPARNALASPYRYDVHPEDLVRLTFEIEASGQQLVGIFHSHPRSGAIPSATDVRDARYDVVYLILSVADAGGEVSAQAALRGWRITDGSATEVPIRLSG